MRAGWNIGVVVPRVHGGAQGHAAARLVFDVHGCELLISGMTETDMDD